MFKVWLKNFAKKKLATLKKLCIQKYGIDKKLMAMICLVYLFMLVFMQKIMIDFLCKGLRRDSSRTAFIILLIFFKSTQGKYGVACSFGKTI